MKDRRDGEVVKTSANKRCVAGQRAAVFLLSVLILIQMSALIKGQSSVKQVSTQSLMQSTVVLAATQQDLERMAESAFAEGEKFRKEDKEESLLKAIEKYEEARSLWEQIGEKKGQAQALYNIGRVYYLLRDNQKAIDFYNRALSAFQSLTVSVEEGEKIAHDKAGLLLNIGITDLAMGESDTALKFYDLALQSFRELRDAGGEAFTIREIGRTHYLLGESQEALTRYSEALTIWHGAQNSREIAYTQDLIGRAYFSLSDYNEANRYFTDALMLQRSLERKEPRREAQFIMDTGRVKFITGNGQEALKDFEQAQEMSTQVGNHLGEAEAFTYMGTVEISLKNFDRAMDYFNQALPIQQEIKDSRGEGETLYRMGQALYQSGKQQEALNKFQKSLNLWLTNRYRLGEANTRFMIARIESDRDRMDEARQQIDAALKIVESQRAEVITPELRTTYFVSERNYYELYVDLLMRLHRRNPERGYDALALNVSERARARTLLDVLGEEQATISNNIPSDLIEQRRRLRRLLNSDAGPQIQLLRNKLPPEREAEVKRRLNEIEREFEQVETRIRSVSPRYAALKQPHILTAPEAQQQLDSDTLMLEYILGDERSYMWVVSPSYVRGIELPPRAEIEALARQFRDLTTKRSADSQGESQAEGVTTRLSQILLGKAAPLLGTKRLVIVTEGALQYVPFAALREPKIVAQPSKRNNSGDYVPLLLNHEIVYEPSLSTLALVRQAAAHLDGLPSQVGEVAIIADPVFSPTDERVSTSAQGMQKTVAQSRDSRKDTLARRAACEVGFCDLIPPLMFSGEEGHKIFELARAKRGGLLAEGFEANKETATKPDLARRYRIIHFSTHALLNNEHPELSGIVLSLVNKRGEPQDGFLQLYEIYGLRMPVQLLVLSACQTALGKDARGEGLIGLTRGFIYAGAKRVVATLWEVDDQATAELMVRFYENMLGAKGSSPASALRAAQVSMFQAKNRMSKPFYWAGFTLQGEWRAMPAAAR